jgi:hypothetical protein
MISRLATFAAVGALAVGAGSLRPDTTTLAAWDEFVTKAENDLHSCRCDIGKPQGKTYEIAGGTIHQWRGELLIKGVTVDEVVNALQSRGVPPPQEDVLESRVLSRSGESVVVYLKLSRQALITVTYDTEHAVTFNRLSPTAAESRSIATRIDEADGRDHGFLWRLNSYWRYEQQHDGVRIRGESLSLSRRVPTVVKPVAGPIITRIGRDSMASALEAVRRFLEDLKPMS